MIYSVLQSYWSYKTSEQKKQMGSLSEKQIHNPPTVDPKCYHHNNLSKHLIKKSRQAKFCQPKKTSVRTEDNLGCQPNHDTIHVFEGYLRQSLVQIRSISPKTAAHSSVWRGGIHIAFIYPSISTIISKIFVSLGCVQGSWIQGNHKVRLVKKTCSNNNNNNNICKCKKVLN